MKKYNTNYENKVFIIESIRQIIIEHILSENISDIDCLISLHSKYIDELTVIIDTAK